jgi:hypothetical protein
MGFDDSPEQSTFVTKPGLSDVDSARVGLLRLSNISYPF